MLFLFRRSLKTAFFSQHHVDQLVMDVTPLEFMQQKFPGEWVTMFTDIHTVWLSCNAPLVVLLASPHSRVTLVE